MRGAPRTSGTPPPAVGDLYRPAGAGHSRIPRGPRVLLQLHDDCTECRTWLDEQLAAVDDDIRSWGGRVERLPGLPRGHDGSGEAWLAIVDDWDEVFHVVVMGRRHAFPDVLDVAEWIRFVAIQCPECEGPEGAWRTAGADQP